MSMADRDGFIWYDGKFVPWRDATTHVLTHSLHYGLAVFEGVRAYKTDHGTAIFRLEHRFDDSRGPDGGFFRGAELPSGAVGVTPSQHLLIFATIFTFDSTPGK